MKELRYLIETRNWYTPDMMNMENWVCVHATKYEPKKNSNDELYIETMAMATEFKIPRATIHTTLNQVVSPNNGGNWDAIPIVVLARYKDVVAKNGNPVQVATEDTYFEPDPDTGLVLPESVFIIRPSENNDKLFEIGEHGATYKTDEYTEEEIKTILALDKWDEQQFNNLMGDKVEDYNVASILGHDEELIKTYEKSKDKKLFMHGIFTEDRMTILNKLLRNAVVELSLRKMGSGYVRSHEDSISGQVAEVAVSVGLNATSGNQGHSGSWEREIEKEGCRVADLADTLKSKDIRKIYAFLTEYNNWPMCSEVIANILSGKSLPDVNEVFTEKYNDLVDLEKFIHKSLNEEYEEDKKRYGFDESKEEKHQKSERKHQSFIKSAEKGLKDYKPHLYTTIQRHSERMNLEFNHALDELRADSENFAILKDKLHKFVLRRFMKEARENLTETSDEHESISNLEKMKGAIDEDIYQKWKKEHKEKIERLNEQKEMLYKKENPELAQLREEERQKIEKGMDSKTAQKERRIAVRKYYANKIEGR